MTIAIIGATGQLGGFAIDALLERGVAANEILALGRNEERLAALAGRGLRTGTVDLDDLAGTTAAFQGVDSLVLISVGGPGEGVPPRKTAVDAAKAAGVGRIVYTSALEAATTKFLLAPDHKATEELIAASGIPATILRNGWYTENHQQEFESARQRGVIANSVGDGRIASATRRDYGTAIAVVLTAEGHEGKTYELSGDVAWTYTEFAAAAQEVLGTPVHYEALTTEQEREQLVAFGLDEGTAGFLGMVNADIRDGVLALANGDLAALLGHPTEPLVDTMRTWA